MRREQNIGKHGQNTAAAVLSGRCGINMVEQIGTPVKLVPVPSNRPNVFQVSWGEKVSGDHRGIIGNGISVLAETKTILDHNLQYSNLREHQPARLSEHADHGGISLLVWVHGTGAYVMRWPIEGFEAGKSISHERAQELDAETIEFLDWVQRKAAQERNAPIDDYRMITEPKLESNDMLLENQSNGLR